MRTQPRFYCPPAILCLLAFPYQCMDRERFQLMVLEDMILPLALFKIWSNESHAINTSVWSPRKEVNFNSKNRNKWKSYQITQKVPFDWTDVSENRRAPEVLLQKVEVSTAEKSFCDVICWGSVPLPSQRTWKLLCFGWHCQYFIICTILCGRIGPTGISVSLS